ncbi:MAG: YceI family protein [Candidatus Marinimicrobia bacterium]|nr:YceI family protein [Candidatus Neomarinimicrobiota bacterium]MCF7902796.1 YceI family protein [Candidatus Neomarinimicrobiota bacterium]
MQFKLTKLQNLWTISLLILPMLSWGGINLDEGNGTLAGLGHARSHDFPVVAHAFKLTTSDPDSQGVRQVKLTVPVESITTENFMRNAHMRMAMFNGEFPLITYRAEILLPRIAAGDYDLAGVLSINGIERPYIFTITVTPVGEGWHATGTFLIKPTDFDMALPGMGPMKVLDKVDLVLDLTF